MENLFSFAWEVSKLRASIRPVVFGSPSMHSDHNAICVRWEICTFDVLRNYPQGWCIQYARASSVDSSETLARHGQLCDLTAAPNPSMSTVASFPEQVVGYPFLYSVRWQKQLLFKVSKPVYAGLGTEHSQAQKLNSQWLQKITA